MKDAHRANADFLRDIGLFIYVDFVKLSPRELDSELFEDWRDDSAWTAPRRPEVYEDRCRFVDLRPFGKENARKEQDRSVIEPDINNAIRERIDMPLKDTVLE